MLLHKFSKELNGQIRLDSGRTKLFHEVASLIDRGDHVYVLVPDSPGCYKHGDKVRIKPGQQYEHLESEDDEGAPTNSLYELIAWIDR